MFDKWLDFMLAHTLAKNIMSNKCMYILLNAQAFTLLKIKLQNAGGTKQWGTKYFKHGSRLSNTMVVPYLDKNHWSLYILEEGCTIHCDFILGYHNSRPSMEFTQNVCIAWALSKGLNEDDIDFTTFVNVDTILPKVSVQKNFWECATKLSSTL
jgi:hypothetical protein